MASGDIDRRIVLSHEEFDRINALLDEPGEVVPKLLAALIQQANSHG